MCQQVAHEAVQRRAAHLNSRRDELYEFDLHLVLLYEGLRPRGSSARKVRELWTRPRSTLRQWLSPNASFELLETDIDRAVAHLHHKAAAFEVLLADSVRPLLLRKDEAFRFFRRLLNYAPHVASGASLKYDTHLDYFIADSSVECHRDHLRIDDARVRVLSVKEPPSATFPQILEDLYTLPGEFIACLEWCRIPNDRMRRDLQVRRRHFFNKRVPIVNYVSPEMRAYPALLEALLFYVLHRVAARINDPAGGGLKLCVMDEAWRFIQHETLRALRAGSAADLSQTQRRNGAGDPIHRRLRVRGPAAHSG